MDDDYFSFRLRKPRIGKFPNWLPSRGNVLFTLLTVVALLGLNRAGALSLAAPAAAPQASTNTIAYQGRIANAGGTPLTGTYSMVFRLYNIAAGGAPLWEETWTGANGVKVSDGLFNVMLGSLTPIPTSIVSANPSLWLGIMVGTDSEMSPRVQLGSVPFSMQALTVPDGSITTTKIADGAVTASKLAGAAETVFTLLLSPAWRNTTNQDLAVPFGTITLSAPSNLHITGIWVIQNNTAAIGLDAVLQIDGVDQAIYADTVPLSAAGIGFTIHRSHYVPNVPAGVHTLGVKIRQFPWRSGDEIGIGPASRMWIRAVPSGN